MISCSDFRRTGWAAPALGFFAIVATAQPPAPPAMPEAARRQIEENNKLADPPGTGRFPAIKEEVATLPNHVVYRPADLAALGNLKLGVVVWGNGGCSDDGASSRFHLLEIASHGYLVIAAGRILSGPGAPPPGPHAQVPAGSAAAAAHARRGSHRGIDWALAENERAGSPYFGRIDPVNVAVSGWSCGGLQALRVAAEPRVAAHGSLGRSAACANLADLERTKRVQCGATAIETAAPSKLSGLTQPQARKPAGWTMSDVPRILPLAYLARHGETAWSLSGRHTGSTDLPLTERGERNARSVGERLMGLTFAAVLTSPLRRASRTCELAGFGAVATVDHDLVEWDYGDYEGKTSAEIHRFRPGWELFRDGCPGGESIAQVAARADRVVARLRALDGNALLFSHGHLLRVLAARWLSLDSAAGRGLFLSTAALSVVGYEHGPDDPVIRLWNDARHVPG